MKKLLFSIFLLSISITAFAGFTEPTTYDYSVTKTGSDSNSCSIKKPCLTLAKACSVAKNIGSTIYIGKGIFTETAQCVLAPTISIKGAGRTVTTVKAGYAADGLVMLSSASEGTLGNQSISDIKFDGNALTGEYGAIRVKGRSNVKVDSVDIIDFKYLGIEFSGRVPVSTGYHTTPVIHATGNVFSNSTINNSSGFFGAGYGAIQFGGQDGLKIFSNSIIQNSRSAGSNGYCLKHALDGNNKNVKIYNNYIERIRSTGAEQFDFAIEMWGIDGGFEVFGNTILGNMDVDYSSKGDSDFTLKYYKNIVGRDTYTADYVSHAEFGLELEAGISDVYVYQNYFKNLRSAVLLYTFNKTANSGTMGVQRFENIHIHNNIALASTLFLAVSSSGSGFATYKDFFMYNNTVDNAGNANVIDGIQLPNSGTASNFYIRNNIIKGFSRSPISVDPNSALPQATIDVLTIEKNNFLSNGNSNLFLAIAGTGQVVPTNKTETGTITTDPLFVSGSDYRLQLTSPNINAGVWVGTTYFQDYRGVTRGETPDIGAIERAPLDNSHHKSAP